MYEGLLLPIYIHRYAQSERISLAENKKNDNTGGGDNLLNTVFQETISLLTVFLNTRFCVRGMHAHDIGYHVAETETNRPMPRVCRRVARVDALIWTDISGKSPPEGDTCTETDGVRGDASPLTSSIVF